MAMTPARAHMLAMTAASLSADDSGANALDPAQTSAYELMQAQLYEHRRALKAIQSIERKVEAKRDYLPLYWPWVDGVLAGGQGARLCCINQFDKQSDCRAGVGFRDE